MHIHNELWSSIPHYPFFPCLSPVELTFLAASALTAFMTGFCALLSLIRVACLSTGVDYLLEHKQLTSGYTTERNDCLSSQQPLAAHSSSTHDRTLAGPVLFGHPHWPTMHPWVQQPRGVQKATRHNIVSLPPALLSAPSSACRVGGRIDREVSHWRLSTYSQHLHQVWVAALTKTSLCKTETSTVSINVTIYRRFDNMST